MRNLMFSITLPPSLSLSLLLSFSFSDTYTPASNFTLSEYSLLNTKQMNKQTTLPQSSVPPMPLYPVVNHMSAAPFTESAWWVRSPRIDYCTAGTTASPSSYYLLLLWSFFLEKGREALLAVSSSSSSIHPLPVCNLTSALTTSL